jgi:hypothetical protein
MLLKGKKKKKLKQDPGARGIHKRKVTLRKKKLPGNE